jgi:hypothetical protein
VLAEASGDLAARTAVPDVAELERHAEIFQDKCLPIFKALEII